MAVCGPNSGCCSTWPRRSGWRRRQRRSCTPAAAPCPRAWSRSGRCPAGGGVQTCASSAGCAPEHPVGSMNCAGAKAKCARWSTAGCASTTPSRWHRTGRSCWPPRTPNAPEVPPSLSTAVWTHCWAASTPTSAGSHRC